MLEERRLVRPSKVASVSVISYLPGVSYRCTGDGPTEVEPSPKSQARQAIPTCPGSTEQASNSTVSVIEGAAGRMLNLATGFPADMRISSRSWDISGTRPDAANKAL